MKIIRLQLIPTVETVGGGSFNKREQGIPKEELSTRVITSTDKDIRFYLMKWIEKNKNTTPKIIGNWNVVPEKFWEIGKEKDDNILYKK